jgi:hypothetical protein
MRGSRPGERRGGRQKGTPNRRTAELQKAVAEASAALEGAIPEAFAGDAHALLIAVYKDPAKDWTLRVDAAKAAIRYEKPALAQVQANLAGQMNVRAWLQSLGEPRS